MRLIEICDDGDGQCKVQAGGQQYAPLLGLQLRIDLLCPLRFHSGFSRVGRSAPS
jgi:hypothetical protein